MKTMSQLTGLPDSRLLPSAVAAAELLDGGDIVTVENGSNSRNGCEKLESGCASGFRNDRATPNRSGLPEVEVTAAKVGGIGEKDNRPDTTGTAKPHAKSDFEVLKQRGKSESNKIFSQVLNRITVVPQKAMLEFCNDMNEDMAPVVREIEDCTAAPTTYTMLTTLQPLSPAPSDCGVNSLSTASGIGSTTYIDLFDDAYSAYRSGADDLTLSGYEFLEPLMPIAVLDSSGNFTDCNIPPSSGYATQCSLFTRTAFITPITRTKFDRSDTGQSESVFSNGGGISSSTRMSLGSTPSSLVSSRSSTPESNTSTVDVRLNVSSGGSVNPKLASALSTVLTMEAFEAFMDTEAVGTHDISEQVSEELKHCNIPQALFARRILCRSQGTLSDLLRNPKPWSKLKSGRDTYFRMWQWLQQPDSRRAQPFDRSSGVRRKISGLRQGRKLRPSFTPSLLSLNNSSFSSPPPTSSSSSSSTGSTSFTESGNNEGLRSNSRRSRSSTSQGEGDKKPRMVFTEAQRKTLTNFFKQTPRPDRELQMRIANQLSLPLVTVNNFFMNARRRAPRDNKPAAHPNHPDNSVARGAASVRTLEERGEEGGFEGGEERGMNMFDLSYNYFD